MSGESSIYPAIVSAAAAVVSGLFAAWTSVRSKRQDRLEERLKLQVTTYDTVLLEQRLKDYRDLWSLTEPTSRRHVGALDRGSQEALAERLTHWYYSGGGMVLSGEARTAFFRARDSLGLDSETSLNSWREIVIGAFSKLRTAMCEDIDSRRGPTSLHGETEADVDARVAKLQRESRQQEQQG
jgi:hypothetical protein